MSQIGSTNPFASQWRDCLSAHFSSLAQEQRNVQNGRAALVMAGFTGDEIQRIYILATMQSTDPLDITDMLTTDYPVIGTAVVNSDGDVII